MKIQIDDKDFEQLLEYDQIKKRTRFLGIQLDVDYENKFPVFIGVLNGSFIFMADLMKEVQVSCEVTFIKVSSYQDDHSSGEVKQLIGLDTDLQNRDVVIVEDIVDTGLTLEFIINEIRKQKPASIVVCTLLFKPSRLEREIGELKYVGFEIPHDFVVGYGLDYNGLGRNLRDIYRAIPVPTET